jgi:IMP dehydrogenase
VEQDEPYGILTSSDLVDAIASGRDLEDTKVSGFRTTPIVLVTPGVRAKDAAQMMTRMNLRHLAVFNGKAIVGIVSNFDLVRAAAKDVRAFVRREHDLPMATV